MRPGGTSLSERIHTHPCAQATHLCVLLRRDAAALGALAQHRQPLRRRHALRPWVPRRAAKRAEREEAAGALSEIVLEHAPLRAARTVANVSHGVKAARQHQCLPFCICFLTEIGSEHVGRQVCSTIWQRAAQGGHGAIAHADRAKLL